MFLYSWPCLAPPARRSSHSSEQHFVLRHEAVSARTVYETWERLIHPETWWHPGPYLLRRRQEFIARCAGGRALERGVVRVVLWHTGVFSRWREGKVLRMDAPVRAVASSWVHTRFGRLRCLRWMRVRKSSLTRCRRLHPSGSMPETAKAVDFVKSEAMSALGRTLAIDRLKPLRRTSGLMCRDARMSRRP